MAWIITATFSAVALFATGLVWWLHPILDHHEGTAAWVAAEPLTLLPALR
jgi:hypothetical protein